MLKATVSLIAVSALSFVSTAQDVSPDQTRRIHSDLFVLKIEAGDCDGAEAAVSEADPAGILTPFTSMALARCFERRGTPITSRRHHDGIATRDVERAIALYRAALSEESLASLARERRDDLTAKLDAHRRADRYFERALCLSRIRLIYESTCCFGHCEDVSEECQPYIPEYLAIAEGR